MTRNTQKPIEIRIRFKENVSEQEESIFWQQVFDVLGIFDEVSIGEHTENLKNDAMNKE